MEVSGPEFQLVATRRTDQGLVQLVFDEKSRSYYYQVVQKGVRTQFDYAGTDEGEALDGYINFLEETTSR